jgi:hypothetical protein
MVDNMNPNTQFHPYQPETSTPAVEKPVTGFGSILQRVGIDTRSLGIDTGSLGSLGNSMKNMDVKGSVEKARGYARANPGMVLGGLAAAVIGMGLMRGKRTA